MQLSGIIKKIGETQTFASGFQKREFVLLTTEQYPQPINLELLSDKVDIIDAFKEGDVAEVGINIRGREWVSPQGETKYFNSIVAWKITRPAGQQPTSSNTAQPTANEKPFIGDEEDDLPF